MLILTDDQEDSSHQPTQRNIIEAMDWLVRGAQPNDSLLIHYAGHGGQKKDYDGDELDGSDEIIYPLDFESAGIIVDDEMNSILVQQLPRGARFEYMFTPPKIGVYGQLYIPKMWHSSLNLNFYVEFGNMIHFAVSAWTSEMPPGIDTPFCPSSTSPLWSKYLQQNESYSHNLHINWDQLSYVTSLEFKVDHKRRFWDVCFVRTLLTVLSILKMFS